MPDEALMSQAMALAGSAAAIVLMACGLGTRRSPSRFADLASLLGLGLGVGLGIWWLEFRPHWPPREDQDRLLFLLLPIVLACEAVGIGIRFLRWPLRAVVMIGTAPLLLYNTSYLLNDWSTVDMALHLGGLALALGLIWVLLAWKPRPSTTLALSLTCAASAVVVMLSGYATGGQIGVPLAGALAGIFVVSLALPHLDSGPAISLGVVGLFSLLIVGHYFGTLTWLHASLLLAAPVIGWLTPLVRLDRLGFWLHEMIRVTLTAGVLGAVVWLAWPKPEPAKPGSPAKGPSVDDYSTFGK